MSISFEVESDLKFMAEWALVNTIIQNLIENAIKYARIDQKEPKIEITVRSAEAMILLTVIDNGVGMDEESKENLFRMFYQGGNQKGGTGLGLYILKRAVENLNGTISVDSQPASGTEFRIALPKD